MFVVGYQSFLHRGAHMLCVTCHQSHVTCDLLAPVQHSDCASQYLNTTHCERDIAHGHVNPSHVFLDFVIKSSPSSEKKIPKNTHVSMAPRY